MDRSWLSYVAFVTAASSELSRVFTLIDRGVFKIDTADLELVFLVFFGCDFDSIQTFYSSHVFFSQEILDLDGFVADLTKKTLFHILPKLGNGHMRISS